MKKNMMMKKNILRISSVFAVALMMTACSDFLDKIPDERTELQSEDNIVDLLKGSYPATNYQYVCELSSDNLIDNNAPHLPSGPWDKQVENHYNYASSSRWTDEMFRFEPALSATIYDGESPGRIWSQWFNSIAAANAALEAIDNLAGTGTVKLEGKLWTARSANGSRIPAGMVVTIQSIEGVKVIVAPAFVREI